MQRCTGDIRSMDAAMMFLMRSQGSQIYQQTDTADMPDLHACSLVHSVPLHVAALQTRHLDSLLYPQPPDFLHKQEDSISPEFYRLLQFLQLHVGETLQTAPRTRFLVHELHCTRLQCTICNAQASVPQTDATENVL